VRELAGRAREKKLQPDEYTGATFSVSNLGMFGIHEFTAIINPPEAGILAVGGIEETPVVVDGEVVVRPRMKVTMSCDHRVIDGAQGSRYLQTLKGCSRSRRLDPDRRTRRHPSRLLRVRFPPGPARIFPPGFTIRGGGSHGCAGAT
jgi:hypothetical protein